MATKGDIKKAILRVAGDPVSGAIAALADEIADADAHDGRSHILRVEGGKPRGSETAVGAPSEADAFGIGDA